jgi:hypothetical protein
MLPILGVLAPILGKAIDKVFPDTEKRDMAKLEIMAELQKQSGEIEKAAAGIINTEAASKHWLAANWRPLTMLTFVALIVARWLGWTADNMSEAEYLELYDLMKIGLGGYVIGRSAEKIAPSLIDKLKSK